MLDMLAAGWLVTYLVTTAGRRRIWRQFGQPWIWAGLMGLLVCGGVGFLATADRGIFLLRWVQVAWLFVWYQGITCQPVDWRKGIGEFKVSLAIVLGLALVQFGLSRSVQGPFWFLGERRLRLGEANVANVWLADRPWLRPYSTFPHPNALAGFLVLAAGWLVIQKAGLSVFGWLTFVLVVGLTFSRPAWVLVLTGAFGRLKKWRFWLVAVALGIAVGSTFSGESFTRRATLNACAVEMINSRPWFGIGWGRYISQLTDCPYFNRLDSFFQPAHNIFLLVLAQAGLIGGALFFGWWGKEVLKWPRSTRVLFWGMVFLGLWDHYLLTAVQVRYLVLAIFLSQVGASGRDTMT